MYYNNYQVLSSARNGYNCMHTYARMLTFRVTAIIHIINSEYAFIKRANMIYHNCVKQGAVYNNNNNSQMDHFGHYVYLVVMPTNSFV